MDKKFIYLIVGIIIVFFTLIISIIFITNKSISLIVNPTKDQMSLSKITPDGTVIYYYDGTNKIMKWNFSTNKVEAWIELPFNSINAISYSPDASKAIIYWSKTDTYYNQQAWLVDLVNKKIVKEISRDTFVNIWSPDSKKIAYQEYNSTAKKNDLIIATPENTDKKTVLSFDENEMTILWPSQDIIVYFPALMEDGLVDVKSINLNTFKQSVLIKQKAIDNALTVNNQNKILFSILGENKSKIDIYDLVTNKTLSLNENSLYLSKITQIDQTDSFYAGIKNNTRNTDNVIRFDINGKIEKINIKLPANIEMSNLASPDKKTLYFFNNNQLYKMKTNF